MTSTKLIITGLIVVNLVGFAFITDVRTMAEQVLTKYHLLPEPEKITELYFENHQGLPNRAVINESLPFRFTIHNLEHQDITYHWEINVTDETTKTVFASGSAELRHDEYETIDYRIRLATASGRTKVEVHLIDQDQFIHFWLEK